MNYEDKNRHQEAANQSLLLFFRSEGDAGRRNCVGNKKWNESMAPSRENGILDGKGACLEKERNIYL